MITLEADLLGLRETHRLHFRGADAHEIHSHPFLARVGAHVVQIEVQIDNDRYFGAYELTFHEPREQAPVYITGPKLEKAGETIVGDDSLQMTVVLPDGSQRDADQFAPVSLRSQLAQRLIRKQVFAPYRHHQLPESCRRIMLRAEHGQDVKRFLLVGGTSFVLGRQSKSCDLTFACPRDENRSDKISRQHAVLQFDAEGITWEDRSRNGTEFTYPWGSEFVAEQRRRLPEQVGLSLGRVLPLDLRCFSCPFPILDQAAYGEFVLGMGQPASSLAAGPYHAVRIQRSDLWSDQEYFLVQHSIAIGRAESAALQDLAAGPARSALIHFLGGMFWLEPFSPEVEIIVAHHRLNLHSLAPLLPGIPFRIGCVEFEVQEFRQETR